METWSIFLLLLSVSHTVVFLNLLDAFGSERPALFSSTFFSFLGPLFPCLPWDCGSILNSLVSSKPVFSTISHYIRRMHIKNTFAISATPCLFLSFLQVSPLCGITCPCSLSTSTTDSSLLGLFCCPFSSH